MFPISETPDEVTTQSVTPTTMIDREDIQETPGADRTNGMEMITDYVPGVYVTHDMLHMRGGHQVEWLIDGVPIPTQISPPISARRSIPKISTTWKCNAAATMPITATALTASSISSPRTGFERRWRLRSRDQRGEFLSNQRSDQLRRTHGALRLLASLNGNRSNYGLQTPSAGRSRRR